MNITARQKGRKLAQDIATTLKPVLTDGHLALARSVAAGEYAVELNNYTNLIINTKLSGAPSDYWALDPVALIFGSVGINTQAPHPKSALLAANFVLSREAQTLLTKEGRLPTRPDVPDQPAGRDGSPQSEEGARRRVLGRGAEEMERGVQQDLPAELRAAAVAP